MHHSETEGRFLSLNDNVKIGTDNRSLVAAEYYEALFKDDGYWRPLLNFDSHNRLSEIEAETLIGPIKEEEVWAAIQAMDPSKIPRPDGFFVSFYQKMLKCYQG